MIDENIIELLNSRDVEARKRAVKALARSNSRDALPYLAQVIKQDKDEEVRELARKAGIYIHKNMPDDAAAEEAAEEDDAPLPSEIRVSSADAERAQSFLRQAMDWHTRGDDARAAQFIQKALKANPRLMYDEYTVSFTSTVTGMDGRTAIKQLAPGKAALRKQSAAPAQTSSLQGILAVLMMVAAATALVGYFLLPWIDMSTLPADTDEQGNIITLRTALDEASDQLDNEQARQGLALFVGEDRANEIINAFTSLKFDFNGLDVTLLSIGARDIFDVMGLNAFYDALTELTSLSGQSTEELALQDVEYTPEPLDYSLPLIPLMAFIALVLAIWSVVRPSAGKWVAGIVVGLLGIIPMLYFYISAVNNLVPEDTDLILAGDISGVDLIVSGYWIALVGMLLILVIPFIGALTLPNNN